MSLKVDLKNTLELVAKTFESKVSGKRVFHLRTNSLKVDGSSSINWL